MPWEPGDVVEYRDVRIKDAGAQAVELIGRRSPIFDEWSTWRPDPDWSVPSLDDVSTHR